MRPCTYRQSAAVLGLTALLAFGCRSDRVAHQSEPQNGSAEAVVQQLQNQLRRGLVASPLLEAPTIEGFQRSDDVLQPISHDVQITPHRAGVSLPVRADAPFRVTDLESGVSVEAVLSGTTSAPAELSGSTVVYRAAYRGHDVIQLPTSHGIEDFVWFERAPEASELKYDLALNEKVAGVRVSDEAIEFVDTLGIARIRVAQPYLVDADGKRLAAHLEADGCPMADSGPAAATPTVSCVLRVQWKDVTPKYPAVLDPSWQSVGPTHVLLLWDEQGPGTKELQSALTKAGMLVTLSPTSSAQFNGTNPSLSTFDSVVLLSGVPRVAPIPSAGQSALLNFVQRGGGLVLGEWTAHDARAGELADMKELVLLNSRGSTSGPLTLSMVPGQELHPVLSNIPDTFSFEGGFNEGLAKTFAVDPSTVLMRDSAGNDAVVARAVGMGHVVEFHFAGDYPPSPGATFTALADVNVQQLYANAVAWTSRAARPRPTYAVPNANSGSPGTSCNFGFQCNAAQAAYCTDKVCCYAVSCGQCGYCGSTSSSLPGGCLPEPQGSTPRQVNGLPNCGNYLCDGSSTGCPSTCTTDAVCVSGYYCDTATTFQCQPLKSTGAACGGNHECSSNFCVDGVCCGSACSGPCDYCAASLGASADGTCTDVGGAPGNPSCAPYLCSSSSASCPNSCTTDAQCSSGNYCSGGTCIAKAANGQACTGANQCTSGNCVNGFCCNSACSGACDFCAASLGASANGTCTDVAGAAGSPSCSPYLCTSSSASCPSSCSSDSQCVSSDFCNGGVCVPKLATGTSCSTASQCASGFCADGYCCNTACSGSCDVCSAAWGASANGVCTPTPGAVGSPPCYPYMCGSSSGSCPTSCTFDSNCVSGDFCNSSNQCVTKQANGATCTTATQCTSGNCADGFCCNAPCSGPCDVCAASLGASANGTCTDVAGAVGSPSCSPYLCTSTSAFCPTTCTNDSECVAGDYCNSSNQCVAKGTLGQSCTAATQCQSGFCADGVCCNSACSGSCDFCARSLGASADGTCTDVGGAAGSPSCSPYLCQNSSASCPSSCSADTDCVTGDLCIGGQCKPKQANGAACTASNQCTSGNCVDGFCCNTACSGACDFCAASLGASANGTCTDVAGAAGTPSCSPYLCSSSSASCPASCTADSQCVAGDFCNGGACVPKLATGTSCSTASQCASGFCADGYCCNSACSGSCDVCAASLGASANGTCTDTPGKYGSPPCFPYVCGASSGTCPTACGADTDCVPGFFCDPSSSTCVAKQSNGSACTAASQCSSGNCADGFCCNAPCNGSCDVCAASLGASADGSCTDVAGYAGSPSCSPYLCSSTSPFCPTTCNTDTDCATGNFCNSSHQCVAKAANGTTCSAATQCASGNCVDGFCCNSACSGACDSCAASLGASANGTCTDVAGAAGTPSCTPYLCSSSSASCPTSCTADSQCVAGDFCNGSACVPRQSNGASCTSATQCASGNCVDGFCCNSACSGSCDFCAASLGASANGTCTDVAGVAGSPSCSPYLCSSSSASCPASCTADSQCVAGDFCSGGKCVPKAANGQTCSTASQCASNFCVDGVCCNTACGSACDACNVTGSVGTCSPSPLDSPGKPSCAPYTCDGTNTSCATTCSKDADCSSGNFCSGGKCVPPQANGASCSAANQCSSGFCADGYCCNTACGGSCDFCAASQGAVANGICTDVANSAGSPSCSPYLCSAASANCPATCTTDTQCVTGDYCSGGKCIAKAMNGQTCSAANQCASNFCVDGVCCNSGCGNSCDACNLTGSVGTCTPMPLDSAGKPSCAPYTCDGTHATCATSCNTDNDCAAGDYCNASHQCVPPQGNGAACTSNRQCSSGSCADGFCCNTACSGSCDFCAASLGAVANGTCTDVAGAAGSPSCSPYLCSSTSASCPASCTADSQCASGDFCSGGKCIAKAANGTVCTSGTQCSSGSCVDGVCCNTSCSGACDFCSAAKGASADGICTDVAGAAGSPSCTPYLCTSSSASCPTSCTADSQCANGDYCNSAGQCVARQSNGASCTTATQCASGNCADGFCCNTACSGSCDFCAASLGASANGVCTDVANSVGSPSCAPYLCTSTSASCPTTCTVDRNCAPGNYCNGGVCAPQEMNGGSCVAANQCTSGNCVDGVCCNTACSGACDACSTAAGAAVNGTCSPVAAGSAGSPSCAPYACNGTGTVCPTACNADTDCVTGDYCNAAHQCIPAQMLGATCARNGQCSSGFCADGVCCNSACDGSCDVCAASLGASSDGLCTEVAGTPGTPSCSPYVCAGGSPSCPTSCSTDAQCAAGAFCSNMVCVPQQANGAQCTGSDQCASGFCADGVCCNTACSGSCNTCAAAQGATMDGVCTTVSVGNAGSPTCSPYLCDGVNPTCPMSCASDTACAAGDFCNASHQCVTQGTNGATCSGDDQCTSGHCADGVCCNTACDGACDYCSAAKGASADGVCTDVAGAPGSPVCAPYLCGGTAATCPTGCMSDADCSQGAFCQDGACVGLAPLGAACAAASQCASGFCADGVCCNTACDGSCDVCAAALGAMADGSCTLAPQGSAGDPTCAPFLCSGTDTSCSTTCSTDSDCATGAFCSNGVCQTQQTNGGTCAANDQCTSGFCVDGLCCDSACNGGCQTCSAAQGAAADGTCTILPAGSAGASSCAPYLCNGSDPTCGMTCQQDSDCGSGAYCNSSNQCVSQQSNGATCSGTDQCSSGNCVDGVCCDTACDQGCDACAKSMGAKADGTCTILGAGTESQNPSCNPFVCDGNNATCPTTCQKDKDCVAGDFCSGGQCVPRQINGAMCTSNSQCGSGFCVDGVCCNTACTDQCAACNVAPNVGTCSPAPMGAPQGMRPVCSTDGSMCGGQCDGVNTAACAYPNAMTACGGASCSNGMGTTSSLCDGKGSCKPSMPVACAPYACGATGCLTQCAADTDCASGFVCNDQNTCVAQQMQGQTCASDSQCATGHCVDNVCCDTACEGSCSQCNAPGKEGTCSPLAAGTQPETGDCLPLVCDGTNLSCPTTCNTSKDCASGYTCTDGACVKSKGQGASCSANTDCGSGFCVDGICCDTACDGDCNSCSQPGHVGQCQIVTGAPVDGHQCKGSGVCGGSCDGTHAQCTYPDTQTTCAPAFCSDATAYAASTCDGAGACVPGTKTSCIEGCQADHCAPLPAAKSGCGGCASTDPMSALMGALMLAAALWRRRGARAG